MKSKFNKGRRVLEVELRVPSAGDQTPQTFRFATFGSLRLREEDVCEFAKAAGYQQAVHQLFDIAEIQNKENKNVPEAKRLVYWGLYRCLSVKESRRKLKGLELEQRQLGKTA